MTQIKDGGPAFPLQSIGTDFAHGYAGMTLRDYFAAKAMQALVSSTENFASDQYAKASYEMADAMLRARGTP